MFKAPRSKVLAPRGQSWVLVALTLASGLAGCFGDARGPGGGAIIPPLTLSGRPPMPDLQGLDWRNVITDPTGDAWTEGVSSARGGIGCPRPTGPALKDVPIEETCYAAQGSTTGAPNAGVPAHPSLDLLAVDVADHPDALVVRFSLAEVRQDLEGAHDAQTGRSTYWELGVTGPQGCYHGIGVDAVGAVAGAMPVGVVFVFCPSGTQGDAAFGGCAQLCYWEVPLVVEPGVPGRLLVAAPLWIFGVDPGRATIGAARTISYGASATTEVRTGIMAGPWLNPGGFVVADDAAPEGEASTRLDPAEVVPVDRFAMDDSGRLGVDAAARDAWRLTRHESWVDGEAAHVILDLASLPEADANTTIISSMTLDGAILFISIDPTDAGWQASGTAYLEDFEAIGVPVTFAVEPGRPGRVTLDVERSQLPHPGRSALASSSAWAFIMERPTDVADAGPAAAAQQYGRLLDFLPPGPPLRLPPVRERAADTQRFQDLSEDTIYPPDALSGDPRSMDVQLVEFASDEPELMRITMSLAQGGTFETPTGYDAMFFAIGIEHPLGTTMVGHYRSPERREGVFLCAPDTTVLPPTPLDPTLGGWTDITGRILQTSGGGARGAGGAASASIVTFVPRSCFDMPADDRELDATALAAGTYLIRRGGAASAATSIHAIDTWRSDDAATLSYAVRPVEPTAFYVAPFGVQNFWDIFGAFLAIATVIATFVMVYRRRRMLRVYLSEIRAIHEEHATDPLTRAGSLVALRARLHDDLLRQRLSDNHFPIIMDRLRSRLTSARLTSMGEAFYDLPPPLAMRLERLLDDGHLSREEGAVLRPLLERTAMQDDARGVVLACIDRWVREDHEEDRA